MSSASGAGTLSPAACRRRWGDAPDRGTATFAATGVGDSGAESSVSSKQRFSADRSVGWRLCRSLPVAEFGVAATVKPTTASADTGVGGTNPRDRARDSSQIVRF